LLKVPRVVYCASLCRLIQDWLDGKVGSGAPTDTREIAQIRALNDKTGEIGRLENGLDESLVKSTYDKLVQLDVTGSLKIATSHRRWIVRCYDFLTLAGVETSSELKDAVFFHDMSKYSHDEALGYAVMFGNGQPLRTLEGEEYAEWQLALTHHYKYNHHHPEFFVSTGPGGCPCKSSMVGPAGENERFDHVHESIIDMLAVQGERLQTNDDVISVKKMFTMEERYFDRYTDSDRVLVKENMAAWENTVREFLSVDENVEKVNGWFDDRRVVYES